MMQTKIRGFSLVELMVALLLSTFLIGGVIGVYIANNQTNRVNTQLNQLQQASQISFQLLGRDIQHAGYSGCANIIANRVLNVLQPQPWWAVWNGGIRGYDNGHPNYSGGTIEQVANTDSLHVMYASGNSVSVVKHTSDPTLGSATVNELIINQTLPLLPVNSIMIGCDSRMAVIFKVTDINGTTLKHRLGGDEPRNSTFAFGRAPDGTPIRQEFTPDAGTVMALESVGWFVGRQNSTQSLYRVSLVAGETQLEEIVPDVADFQIQYLAEGSNSYQDASAVVDWTRILSVRAILTLAEHETIVIAEGMRQITQVVNLRNRKELM